MRQFKIVCSNGIRSSTFCCKTVGWGDAARSLGRSTHYCRFCRHRYRSNPWLLHKRPCFLLVPRMFMLLLRNEGLHQAAEAILNIDGRIMILSGDFSGQQNMSVKNPRTASAIGSFMSSPSTKTV